MIVYGVIDDVIIDSQQNGHPNLVGVIFGPGAGCFGLAILSDDLAKDRLEGQLSRRRRRFYATAPLAGGPA